MVGFLSGCERPAPTSQPEQKIEGILEEVDGTDLNTDWYRLKFKGGMTVIVRNRYEPFYLGHYQIIYYKKSLRIRGPYVTRIVCKDYNPEQSKVAVKREGKRIYVDKSKKVFGETVYKMTPIEEKMESVE